MVATPTALPVAPSINPFASAPASNAVPQPNVVGAIGGLFNNALAAGKANAASAPPISSSPFANPSTNIGPPVPIPAGPAFKSQAPITFANPTLNTPFTPTSSGTITAPAVVTSEPAEKNINNVTTAVNGATADTAAANANKVQTAALANAAANTTTQPVNSTSSSDSSTPTTTPTTTGTDTSDDLGNQINEILNGLSTDESTTATATPDEQSTIDQDNSAIAGDNQQLDPTVPGSVAYNLNSMANGTFPLTPGEQTQINDAGTTYTGALSAAQEYAQNVQGGATAAGAASGLQEYSPAMAMANIHAAITQGAAKVGAVNSRINSAMTKIQTALQNQDYKTANDLYNNISKDITNRSNEIDKINTSINDQTKQMQTASLAVAKEQISALTSEATQSQDAYYKAQNLILAQTRLSDTERKDAMDELNSANGTRTQAERAATALSQFASAFVPGAKMSDGTPTVDENGYITPSAFKAAIADAPAEGITRADFIKQFGSMLYSDPKTGINGRAYGLTPAEIKLITGALPSSG